MALVVDTGEESDELDAATREQSVVADRVDDTQVATTRAGQRITAGDRIATRRNDRALAVANRDTWTVTAVERRGELTVVPGEATAAAPGERMLPADHVTEHVQLAYASTAHGAQGDTVTAANVVIGEHTGAASAYVGTTRAHTSNTAHLVATDLPRTARAPQPATDGRRAGRTCGLPADRDAVTTR
ncbi:hypothetical protein SAMN05660350_02852 [Geodermatophilus obscurus]|uniref:UvrD-like helicase C-terminal domain-containing protein n=1 Tax=Geodermatophilus obscurus TaxID=1861 RepID=A0A1M7UAV9_9ACTN|nr:hypothetical protein SAMN05660350_02852 [Geodermatophilus obscurus]